MVLEPAQPLAKCKMTALSNVMRGLTPLRPTKQPAGRENYLFSAFSWPFTIFV